MVNILLRYGVALHLALLVVFTSWARGGSEPAHFWALPWLALGIVEMMLLLPPMRASERSSDAWRRLRRGLVRDPVLYIGGMLVLLLAIQWLNGPRTLEFVTENDAWAYSPPPWPGLPFCVVRSEALQVLLWGLTVYAVLLAVRHGLSRAGKLLLLRLIAVNGALLAIVGLAQFASGTDKIFWVSRIGAFFFATFGYPNHAGAFFTLLTALSGGLLLHALGDRSQQHHGWWLGLCLVLNALGSVFSLSRAGIVLTAGVLLAGGIYAPFYLWSRLPRSGKMQIGMGVSLMLALAALLYFATPDNPVRREARSVDLLRLQEELLGDRKLLASAAIDIWQDYPWTGVGGWGFRRYVALYLGKEHWDYLRSAGRANVHNDPLQYLCEHGFIGFGLILALIFTLIAQLWLRLARTPRQSDGNTVHCWFLSVSPLVWAIMAGTTATVIHSLIDLPFRSVAIVSVWFICLSSASAFVPRRKPAPAAPVPGRTGARRGERRG